MQAFSEQTVREVQQRRNTEPSIDFAGHQDRFSVLHHNYELKIGMIILLILEKLDQSTVSDPDVFIAWEEIKSVGCSKHLNQMSDEGRFPGPGFAP
jgi:hypothetical protein